MGKKKDSERARKLFEELENYRDMDLHDQTVITDIKGIQEDLEDCEYKVSFYDLIQILSEDE